MMKWKTRTEELETEVSNWRTKYSDLDGEYNISRKRVTELDSHLAMERGKYKELNTKYLAYDAKYTELEDLKSSSDAKLGTLNAQYKSFDTRYKELEAQHNSLLAKHKTLSDDLESCKAKGKKLQDDLSAAESKLSASDKSLEAANERLNIEKAKSDEAAAKLKEAETTASKSSSTTAGIVGAAGLAGGASALSADEKTEVKEDLFSKSGQGSNLPPEPQSAGDGKWSKLKTNNLQIIEGIGPKMNEVLNENGISSWSVLASKSPEALRTILDKYGDKYNMIDPTDWPKQAALAKSRDWDGLIKYQSDDGSPSKAKSVLIKMGIYEDDNASAAAGAAMSSDDGTAGPGKWSKLKTSNLQIIEGIGPKMNEVLNDNGISSWAVLASKSFDELRVILDKYEDKYRIIDPSDWAKQAEFAANGDWDGLIKHQSDDGSPSKAENLLIKLGIRQED